MDTQSASRGLRLAPLGGAGVRPVLCQGSDDPVFRGPAGHGADYLCHDCGGTLLEQVGEAQVWNVAFQCRCGALNDSPPWPPGMPLPQQRVVAGKGRFMIAGAVELKATSVFTSEDTTAHPLAARRALNATRPNADLTSTVCRSLVERVRAALGPEIFDRIEAAHRRGKESPTPPRTPHRLMELVDDLLATADSLDEDDVPDVNVTSLVELKLAADLFELWADDPAWPEIRDSIKNPPDFPHSLATLGAATLLIDAGNPVGLNVVCGERAADLRLQMNAVDYVGGEVKTPAACQAGTGPINTPTARHVVKRALSSAQTTAGGQLGPDRTGFLVIAGFHRSDSDLDALETAAHRAHVVKPRSHLLAIVIVGIGVLLNDQQGRRSLGGTMSLRVAPNPHYSGDIELNSDPRPGLQPVPQSRDTFLPPSTEVQTTKLKPKRDY